MKPVRIFRHVGCEGPGYLGTFLDRHTVPYEVVCIDESVPVPQDLDDISGLVFMGGAMNVTDPLPWIQEEQVLIRKAIGNNVPLMGICLGGQLMSAALGGTVTHGPGMEIGWHGVHADSDNKDHPWLQSLPDDFTPFHWHADTFSIPAGAIPLLHSQCRPNEAFVINNSLALQFHLEMTSDMVKEWVSLYPGDLGQGYACAQTGEEILSDLDQRITALHDAADIVYCNWLNGFL